MDTVRLRSNNRIITPKHNHTHTHRQRPGLQKLALARKPKDNTTPVICETKKGGEKKKQLKLRSQKIVHFKMRLKYIYHISFTALLRAANTHTHSSWPCTQS